MEKYDTLYEILIDYKEGDITTTETVDKIDNLYEAQIAELKAERDRLLAGFIDDSWIKEQPKPLSEGYVGEISFPDSDRKRIEYLLRENNMLEHQKYHIQIEYEKLLEDAYKVGLRENPIVVNLSKNA